MIFFLWTNGKKKNGAYAIFRKFLRSKIEAGQPLLELSLTEHFKQNFTQPANPPQHQLIWEAWCLSFVLLVHYNTPHKNHSLGRYFARQHAAYMSVTLVGTGLDNGLLPVWRQAIVLTGAGLSLIRPTGTIFKLSLMTTLFNIWSANWQPSFVCACVLPPIFCLMPFVQVLDWYFWIATFFELGLAFQEWEVDIAFCGGLVSSGHRPLPESMLTPRDKSLTLYPKVCLCWFGRHLSSRDAFKQVFLLWASRLTGGPVFQWWTR